MSPRLTISLHAELLSNIRQLTLYVSLPDKPGQDSRIPATIALSPDRRAVTVSYSADPKNVANGAKIVDTIELPARVSKASQKNLVFDNHQINSQDVPQTEPCREFSFRLQIDPEDDSDASENRELYDAFVPWQADDMLACTDIVCRFCSQETLSQPTTTEESRIVHTSTNEGHWKWKNLPSGNWAEMMDFWHCHKPDSHDRQEKKAIDEQNAAVKGYGAANQVLATPGTILVDVASFLVSDADCHGTKKLSNSDNISPSSKPILECNNCGETIGMYDPTSQGWRLYKANVCAVMMKQCPSISGDSDNKTSSSLPNDVDHDTSGNTSPLTSKSIRECQSPETIVSAQLLELIEREGIRRCVLHSGQKHGYLLWPFNPDLRYSYSSSSSSSTIGSPSCRVTSQRALKIFYQWVSDVEAILEPERGKPASVAVEEVFLPKNILTEVVQALERSNMLLPRCARVFKEWKVGLLKRFERKETTKTRARRPTPSPPRSTE